MIEKENSVKKHNIFILAIVLTIITIIGLGTYALLVWTSEENTELTVRIGGIAGCYFESGANINVSNIGPIFDYEKDGESAFFTITNNTNDIVSDATASFKVTSLTDNLKEESFKWVVMASTDRQNFIKINEGNFSSVASGSTIQLVSNDSVGINASVTYKLIFYIDGNQENPISMQGGSLSGYISAGACGSGLDSSGAALPELVDGLIPVYWDEDETLLKASSNNSGNSWYDYGEKRWANAVLVSSPNRSTYVGAAAGTEIAEEDVLAYYVWIPRYKYSMSDSVNCSDLGQSDEIYASGCYSYTYDEENSDMTLDEFVNHIEHEYMCRGFVTNDVNNNLDDGYIYCEESQQTLYMDRIILDYEDIYGGYIEYTKTFHSDRVLTEDYFLNAYDIEHPISIVFEDADTPKSTGTATGTSYRTHPAFTFGTDELNGIWVGKFDLTGDQSIPTILPNAYILSGMDNTGGISDFFDIVLNFAGGTLSSGNVSFGGNNTYGLTNSVDSHMMKNSEWGAVAYLSHSIYGKNKELTVNNYSVALLSGCGSSTATNSSTLSNVCENSFGYGGPNYPQSTTGNITGIFDMSGGGWEYVMGNYNNTLSSSGFSSLPNSKYYDLYTTESVSTACSGGICYGHALSEVAGWYDDTSTAVTNANPWYLRGGANHPMTQNINEGLFYFNNYDGGSRERNTARAVLIP